MASRTFCLYDQQFVNSGEGEGVFVAVLRERGQRPLEIGGFFVDLGCTGIKDAFYTQIDESELEDFKADGFPAGYREESAAWARKLFEDAQAYAKSLGLKPHRDYKKAARVLGGVRASDCDETFHFGKDGKPFYFQGKHSDEEARRMVEHLNRRLGADGFHFMVKAPSALSETVEERVDYFLEQAEAGRLKKAKAGIEALLEEHPGASHVHFARGVIAIYENNHVAGIESFDRAIEIDPDLDEAWMNKASAHAVLLQPVEMVAALLKVCELTASDDELHLLAQEKLADFEELVLKNEGLTLDDFLEAEAYFAQALDCYKNDAFEEAIRIMKDDVACITENERTLTLLGACYRGLKKWKLSREALERALEIKPGHPTARMNIVMLDAEEQGGDVSKAIIEGVECLQKEVRGENLPDDSTKP